jgi:uncharacterized protein YodC (DUF2158 family)
MSDAIKEGDTVRLKSGGPLMTAASVAPEGVNCEWFDEKIKHNSSSLKPRPCQRMTAALPAFP